VLSFQRIPQRLAVAIRNLGFANTVHYLWQQSRLAVSGADALPFRSRFAASPVWCRRGTSDLLVFGQIFMAREYRCVDHLTQASVIVDCGANTGLSSVYSLSRFPNANVISIEPDEGNFAALQRNLTPYGSRATALNMGLWERQTQLIVERGEYLDGLEWSFTVREAEPDENWDVRGIDIPTLLAQSGHERISILKVDIEGAERYVFSGACEWLRLVNNIVIELHGSECERIVSAAVAPHGFSRSVCDELTVFLKQ
jgi:FkbM family methyltransferase